MKMQFTLSVYTEALTFTHTSHMTHLLLINYIVLLILILNASLIMEYFYIVVGDLNTSSITAPQHTE